MTGCIWDHFTERALSAKSPGRGGLQDEPFSFHCHGKSRVEIRWRGGRAGLLSGTAASRFLIRVERLSEAAQQQEMARVTGNFKRGNERAD